jgi:type IV secretory pathway VirB6-like protein
MREQPPSTGLVHSAVARSARDAVAALAEQASLRPARALAATIADASGGQAGIRSMPGAADDNIELWE